MRAVALETRDIWCVREGADPTPPKTRLLDRVREAIRVRHYSGRTERAYVGWIRRFILFHGKRHPAEMGAAGVSRFLSALAMERKVSASTQNQALPALLFLYARVLGVELPWLDDLVRANRPSRLPVVLSRDENRAVLTALRGTPRLMRCCSTVPACASSNAPACASRTSTLRQIRSSVARARETG